MKLKNLFKAKQVLSFEVFPPKRTAPVDSIYEALDSLRELHPDFISVTYGAGGSENCAATLEIASSIKNKYGIESVAHLPCINLSKEDVLSILRNFRENGIENILALRGDANPEIPQCGDFRHASDLIAFIKENGNFNIIGACYPEGHPQSENMVNDIRNLKKKVESGCDQLNTQLFFDNEYFYRFRERCILAGIDVPVEAGIMPVLNKKQIERMVTLCRVCLPTKFIKMMERYEHNPDAMRDAGIAYAVDQIVDLIAQGVQGIHLYTMNRPDTARRIHDNIAALLA